ncbi:MAG: hypothetical protein ACFFEN_08095 [Candidatus Thorarchaeota archaeon]
MRNIYAISKLPRIISAILCLLGGIFYILVWWNPLGIYWASAMLTPILIMGILSIIGALLEGQSVYSQKYPKGGCVLCLIVGLYSVLPIPLPFFGIGLIYINSPILRTGIIVLLIGGIVGLVGTLYEKNSK